VENHKIVLKIILNMQKSKIFSKILYFIWMNVKNDRQGAAWKE
jgi:hypothetical protein